MIFWGRLRRNGVLGLNSRNLNYIMRFNPRRAYPNADNKLLCKEQARQHGIPVPNLYGVVEFTRDISGLLDLLEGHEDFVMKPVHGSGGDGVLVVTGREGPQFKTARGRSYALRDLQDHCRRTLHGLYSLGGQPDMVMIEYRVKLDQIFEQVSYSGVPDIRVICFQGIPLLAMLRLPTSESGGRANLHQGAIGVGIDIGSGVTSNGVRGSTPISEHPDTRNPIGGIKIPSWDRILAIAAGFHAFCGLGYVGVDIVLDKELGPLVLEINARPGLAIQLANRIGLESRLSKLLSHDLTKLKSTADRVNFGRALFGG